MNKKIIISVIALIGIVLSIMIIVPNIGVKGEVTIEIVGENKELISKENHKFKEQTLLELLKENYDIKFENGMILKIDTLHEEDFSKAFIGLYVDGEMSMVGINDIELKDGITISFRYEAINFD